MKTTDISPTTVTYTALISAYAKAREWQLAESALQEMQDNRIAPDAVTYNALLAGYEEVERGISMWSEAEQTFKKMQSAGVSPN